MEWFPASKDHLPLTWYKQTPVYLAAVIALVGVASMVFTAVLTAIHPGLPQLFTFSANKLLHGWIWTPVTYVLVNDVSIWFIITSYFLWNFGEAVERHLGRWSFVKLIGCLVLVSPLLLSALGLVGVRDWPAAGMWKLEFGIFLAFATLYPTAKLCVPFLGPMDAWVIASVFVGVAALSDLAQRNWAGLFVLAGEVGTAVGYIRYEQGRLQLPSLRFWPKKARLKPVSRPQPGPSVNRPASPSKPVEEDVDAILEKISLHGLSSLTASERSALEKASDQLSKRGKPGR